MENRKVIKKWAILSSVALVIVFVAYSLLSAFIMFVPSSWVISSYRNNSAVFEEAAIAILDEPSFTKLDLLGKQSFADDWYVDIDSVPPSVAQVARVHKFRTITRGRGVIMFYRERAFFQGHGLMYWDETRELEEIVDEWRIFKLVPVEGRWYYFRLGG